MIKRKKASPSIPVSSMADIAFLLLVFFMVTSVLDSDPDVPIMLPEVQGGEQLKEKISNIYLGGDKSVHYNTMKMSLPEAINHVRAKIISNPEMKVLIHADRNIPFSEVDAVFEKLKEIGATKISLVTQTNPGGG